MGKLASDIAFLSRNNKRRLSGDKKQEIKPKRKKRKKDLEKLHRNAVEASKNSFTRVYRNGAKGKEIRKGNLPPNKFSKARLQGEVAKLLDRDTSKKMTNVFESSPEMLRVDLGNKEKNVVEEDSFSSEGDTQCSQKVSKKKLTTSRKFPWSAMFRYEEFCAIICSKNFDNLSIFSQLSDPLQKVKESLKRIHMTAMRQHFSRPDMDINDFIIDLNNQNSSKTLVDETNSIYVPNMPIKSLLSNHSSNTTLTADAVEDSHPETSLKITSEVDDKSQSSNILFSIPKEHRRTTREMNVDITKNFHLPSKLFDQPCSTITTSIDNESIIGKKHGRCKCDDDDIKCNARLKKHDKLLFTNCTKYIEDVNAKNMEMGRRFSFIKDFSKKNVSHDCAHARQYVEDLVKTYKSRCTIQDTADINDTGVCTNLRDRAMAWKANKSLKHVPAILRRSACDPTIFSDLTYTIEQKSNSEDLKGTSKKQLDFNLDICPTRSTVKQLANGKAINVQRVKTNKHKKNQHRTMTKEKPSTSTHQTINFHIPVEENAGNKNNNLNITKESYRYTQSRPQKSIMFSKGILLNADASTMQLHPDQNHDTTKSINVDKPATTIHPINYQIVEDSQHFLLNSERVHQPDIAFIQPAQYTECSQNPRDNSKNVPVYLQIINQPMKARAEQNVTNQSVIQQPVVPVTSQKVQFMFRENDPRLYSFNELQNLKLLTLNDSQNMYVSTLNSTHEQKRANECTILHNVNQPTKYLAFEKDVSTERIPIYFHNNNKDKTVTQQYLPCKVVTAVEKQNNDKMFIREPSQVILVQGNNLHDGDRQFIDPNYKYLI